ncbi:MAG: hypothetical protein ACHP79_14040, partial [Terriglobales bacterium]
MNHQKCFGWTFGTSLQRPVAAADGSKCFNSSFLRCKVVSALVGQAQALPAELNRNKLTVLGLQVVD